MTLDPSDTAKGRVGLAEEAFVTEQEFMFMALRPSQLATGLDAAADNHQSGYGDWEPTDDDA